MVMGSDCDMNKASCNAYEAFGGPDEAEGEASR